MLLSSISDMTNALSIAYPPERTPLGLIFRPVVDPYTYLRVVHLFLMFPLGIAYFVFLVTTISFGGSLIWTFPGAAVLLSTVFISRFVGDLESRTVTAVTGVAIKRPPWRLEGIEGWRGRLWARLIDPTTWTGLVYLVGQFPTGIAAFVSLVAAFSVAGALAASPFILLFTDETIEVWFGLVIDTPVEALWLAPAGILVFLVTLHFATAFSALHAIWARFMLGSRAASPRPSAELPVNPDPASSKGPEAAGHSKVHLPPQAVPSPVRPFSVGLSPANAANPPPTPAQVPDNNMNNLTPREREVVLLIAEGLTNAEIAEACFISQGTVKTHVKRILSKLELRDRAQVVVYAYETRTVVPRTTQLLRSEVRP